MSYITSTLVEFERDQIESIPDNLLTRQKIRMQSFYYELYDSYLRGDKYIVRYMFYSLKSVRKLTPLQLRKNFSKLMPKTEPIAPEAMKDIRQETAGRGVVVYLHGNHDPGNPAHAFTGKQAACTSHRISRPGKRHRTQRTEKGVFLWIQERRPAVTRPREITA